MSADLARAVDHYRELAPIYDRRTRRINRIRERTIEALGLRPGDTVLDAGCGTGWCLPRLARAVGATGRIIAFDPSPEMLALAQGRLPAGGRPRADLLRACAQDVVLPVPPDAILLSYTHDLLRSQRALENLFSQARPGARVAATSTKLYSGWLFPANWYLRYTHRSYITDFDGFEAPWSRLASLLDDFSVETSGFTQHYVATGRVRG